MISPTHRICIGEIVASLYVVDISTSPSVSLTIPPLSLSLSIGLVVESASPCLSSTIPPPSRSPRRLRVSLALHDGSLHLSLRPVAIIDEIKPKSKAKWSVKRHEVSSKKRDVLIRILVLKRAWTEGSHGPCLYL
ncbi:hypothetical protein YC2023_099253 [Brassica napus]